MDRVIDLREHGRALRMVPHRIEDVGVALAAHHAGRCASCGAAYATGARIGYSRDADGWVAGCCAADVLAPTTPSLPTSYA
jgi:hypothetical protein